MAELSHLLLGLELTGLHDVHTCISQPPAADPLHLRLGRSWTSRHLFLEWIKASKFEILHKMVLNCRSIQIGVIGLQLLIFDPLQQHV